MAAGPATLAEAIAVGDKYEYEDPATAWIALVEAAHEPDLDTRKRRVAQCLFEAKNSHWTLELWRDLCEAAEDVEYGGPAGWEAHEAERSASDGDSEQDEEMAEGAAVLGTLVDSQWE